MILIEEKTIKKENRSFFLASNYNYLNHHPSQRWSQVPSKTGSAFQKNVSLFWEVNFTPNVERSEEFSDASRTF